jgi:hypothetical protein
MKFEVEDVISVLKESKVPPDSIDDVMRKLAQLAEELEEARRNARTPRSKKKIVLLNPTDTASYYPIEVAVDADLNEIVPNIRKSIGDYNQSAKKKKVEINNLAEAIEFIPKKILKDNGVVVKSQSPCETLSLPSN